MENQIVELTAVETEQVEGGMLPVAALFLIDCGIYAWAYSRIMK